MKARSLVTQILAAGRHGIVHPRGNTSSASVLDSAAHSTLATSFSRSSLASPHSSSDNSASSAPQRSEASGILWHLCELDIFLGPDSSQQRCKYADRALVHGRSPAQSRAGHCWLTPRGTPALRQERYGHGRQSSRPRADCLGAQSATCSPLTILPSSSIRRSLHTHATPLAAPVTGDFATSSPASSPETLAAPEPNPSTEANASSAAISFKDDPLPASAVTLNVASKASSPAAEVDRLSAGEPHRGTRSVRRSDNPWHQNYKKLLACVSGVNLQACASAGGQVPIDLVVSQIQQQWVLLTGACSFKGGEGATGHGGVTKPHDLRKLVTKALQDISDSCLLRSLLKWAREEQGIELDSHLVNVLVTALARAGDLEGVLTAEAELQQDGFLFDEFNYCSFMSAYHSLGRTDLAFLVPRKMAACKVKMTAETFSRLMSITLKTGRLRMTWKLYSELQRRGIQPDLITYTVVLEACRVSRDVVFARDTFRDLLKQGLKPDDVAVNTLLTLYKETGNTQDAAALFASLRSLGLEPNVYVRTTYLDLLCKQGRIEEAESVLKELQGRQLAGNAVAAWSSMVHMYGTRVGAKEALECFQRSVLSGVKPNNILYSALVYALVLRGSYAEASVVLEFLEARGATPRIAISSILLSKCASTGADSVELITLIELFKTAGGEVKDLVLLLLFAETRVHPHKGARSEFELEHCVPQSQRGPSSTRASSCSSAHTETTQGGQETAWKESLMLLNKLLDSTESDVDERTMRKNFGDSLLQFLHRFGLEKAADVVWNVFLERGLFDGKVSLEPSDWKRGVCRLDLHGVSQKAAASFLRGVLGRLKELHATGNILPSEIHIITGWGRGSASFNQVAAVGTLRDVVQEALMTLGLHATLVNKGRFSVSSASLMAWMENSAKEGMPTSCSTNIDARNIQRCLQEPIDTSRFQPKPSQMEILKKSLSLLGVVE